MKIQFDPNLEYQQVAIKSVTDIFEGLENAYIAADEIEVGFGNKIPLWLFGFMY